MAPHKVSKNVIGLFLRRSCPGCGSDREEGDLLCPWCSLRLVPCRQVHWSFNGLPFRGTPGTSAEEEGPGVPVYSALLFAGLPGELLRRLKFKGEKHLAATAADLMVRYSPALPRPGEIIVPVPAGRRRKRERGYNQAALIARRLASRTGAAFHSLLRREDGPSQVGLSTADRRKNVEGVFHPRGNASAPAGSMVWIVDDVATTFSTVHAAAMKLMECGAVSVSALTLAYRRKTADSIIRNELR